MNYLFEVSWEVCNKVGGINTVLRSKAPHAVRAFADGYTLLGPWLDSNPEFEESKEESAAALVHTLAARGLKVRIGRWAIAGRPRVILVDFKGRGETDKILFSYWQQFGVESLEGGWDYIEPVLFSSTCGEVIEAIHEALVAENDRAVAHFHEWMCGGGLLYLKQNVPEIGTVFTTHATILGRSMSGQGLNVYSPDIRIDPSADSKRFGVSAKHSMESACAREADAFTTVSEVTADESEVILGVRPSHVVYNGVDVSGLPPAAEMRKRGKVVRKQLLSKASTFLQRELSEEARLWVSSGRYEFHNKGFDVFLEALARLERKLVETPQAPEVVAWFLVASGHKGVPDDVRRRMSEGGPKDFGPLSVATHKLWDESNDSILRACQKLGLRNAKENKVLVIFTPAYLDGDDGVIDLPYYDVLPGFDLGVFPSYYEPWGYTPLESIAATVPTLTTDLAGFGRWARQVPEHGGEGVIVIDRAGRTDENVLIDLYSVLEQRASLEPKKLEDLRRNARAVAEHADWGEFFKGYLAAYETAAMKSSRRVNTLDTSAFSDDLFTAFHGAEGPGPHYRSFTVVPALPASLSRLSELAHNLWWSWHTDAMELFEELDENLWIESNHNPVRTLGRGRPEILFAKSRDKAFLKKYERVLSDLDAYLARPMRRFESAQCVSLERPIAYFSMEFCLHECLPIYSGGLGVLSGDHLKAASDLGIPLVAVGLFYRQGYFKQSLDSKGNQVEQYPFLDASTLPISAVRRSDGREARVSMEIAGRQVQARIWRVAVGRVSLYLLDCDVDENSPRDRQITWQLYGGDRRTRIEQEIVLGIGGTKVIEDVLGMHPAVFHLNEGHCGFLLFDRIRRFMERGMSFGEAREAVKATSVFTTHTPVPAGNESFELSLMEQYFTSLAPKLGISFDELVELGLSRSGTATESFSMTVLALKLTSHANAVSKLHGVVCRQMWKDVWKDVAVEEVPITAITNGIHLTSWIGPNMQRLLGQYTDIDWDTNHDDSDAWAGVDGIPDEMLWYEHTAQKRRLYDEVRQRVLRDYSRRGEDPRLIRDVVESLDANALTVGFARRFATYKRAALLFKDRPALVRLLNDPEKPMMFLFAGKAHPADGMGKDLIRYIVEQSRTPELRGRLVYLENYDMALGRFLTQGVDLWLNTPLRPHEASGTSGMKVLANGGLNCSVLDGWWDEGFEEGAGWAIRAPIPTLGLDHQDELDNMALLQLLEKEIVQCYFSRDNKNLPRDWVRMMKQGLKKLAPHFTTMRMVSEYTSQMYLPSAQRGLLLMADDFAGIRALTDWKRKLGARFSTVRIERLRLGGIEGDVLAANTTLEVEMMVNPGRLEPAELRAELLIGHGDGERFLSPPVVIASDSPEPMSGSTNLRFRITHKVDTSGLYMYALRVVPVHALLVHSQETGLVRWA
ncbi:MAG: alpha-glucan family phosphorylase [Myxococcota bacterium]|jgi:phosphorylase/glycogen(starch) synthase|nr:alpha-glucan family phosphorylase [Myxococcota bacterium]